MPIDCFLLLRLKIECHMRFFLSSRNDWGDSQWGHLLLSTSGLFWSSVLGSPVDLAVGCTLFSQVFNSCNCNCRDRENCSVAGHVILDTNGLGSTFSQWDVSVFILQVTYSFSQSANKARRKNSLQCAIQLSGVESENELSRFNRIDVPSYFLPILLDRLSFDRIRKYMSLLF